MTAKNVFINCPFSPDYDAHFRALIFVVIRSGYTPRCARENDDGGEFRFEKICNIIKGCRIGIHDISMAGLDPATNLARFNMPFELGLFLGARKLGGAKHSGKKTLILDTDAFRYRTFLSDIGGQDVIAHDGNVNTLIERVATWFRDHARDPDVPGGRAIATEYARFTADLPDIAAVLRLEPDELTFKDLHAMMAQWIVTDAAA